MQIDVTFEQELHTRARLLWFFKFNLKTEELTTDSVALLTRSSNRSTRWKRQEVKLSDYDLPHSVYVTALELAKDRVKAVRDTKIFKSS